MNDSDLWKTRFSSAEDFGFGCGDVPLDVIQFFPSEPEFSDAIQKIRYGFPEIDGWSDNEIAWSWVVFSRKCAKKEWLDCYVREILFIGFLENIKSEIESVDSFDPEFNANLLNMEAIKTIELESKTLLNDGAGIWDNDDFWKNTQQS